MIKMHIMVGQKAPATSHTTMGKKYAVISLFMLLFLVLASVPSFYFFRKYQSVQSKLAEVSGATEARLIVERAGRHIVLPTGEEPRVLTVTDKERLSGQAFFLHAKNGDKVLVYTDAKKAFLYDPTADKIIEVGPVNFNATESAQATTAGQPTPTPQPLRFVLYNGTSVVGLTKAYEPTLKQRVPGGAVVVDRDNAARQDYEASILVDLTGSKSVEIEELGKTLGITVGSLPAGETKPDGADFLIILGNDKK